MINAIPYYRVSTNRQGESGLGLDAQRKSVQDFAKAGNLALTGEFIEIESGKNDKRPVLAEALLACKKAKGILLIAKLDRLSRSVAFISSLMNSKVEFIAVNMPSANRLVLHILAAIAEHERDQISTRTKEAMQAAKRRGVKLGMYGSEVLSKENRHNANEFALKMSVIIDRLNIKGFSTNRQLRDELNRTKIPTYRGGDYKWHLNTVFNLRKRVKQLTVMKDNS